VQSDGNLRHLKSCPVIVSSVQYRNLKAVKVVEAGKHRIADKGEFGRLLQLLNKNVDLPDDQLLSTINGKLKEEIPGINKRRETGQGKKSKCQLPLIQIDLENLELLKAHRRKRNDRGGKQLEAVMAQQPGTLGRLHELHLIILRLKRELQDVSRKIRELKDRNPDDANLKDMQKKKGKIIKTLKAMRRHQLNARDYRVSSYSHEIMKIALSSDKAHGGASADILVLPQIKDKDPSRKPGQSRWSKLQNTLLLAGRSAQICDKVAEICVLFAIPALRVSMFKADLVCPTCRSLGLHYWKEGDEIQFSQNINRDKSEALPMPRLPSFGCPNGCQKAAHPLHLQGGEMIHRICIGGDFNKPTDKPSESRTKLLKILKKL
jgi:hypothetical protein